MPENSAYTALVRLDKLHRHFQEGGRVRTVLQGIDLGVKAGASLALRGRSGSGKSTLLNLISGIDLPDSGRVVLNGQDMTAMSERGRTLYRRKHIGFVYQAFNLVPTLSVADNIRLVLELNGTGSRAARSRVAGLLDAVGLGDRGDSYPEVLSGGEQQRVSLARAIAHRPSLILADEPTGNLDDDSAAVVLQLLETLRREQGSTLIMATHSAAIANRCDDIAELRAGQLVMSS